jgi:hypothetical protein
MLAAKNIQLSESAKRKNKFQLSGYGVNQDLTTSCLILRGKREGSVRTKRAKVEPIVSENAPEHPYKKYESHPYWTRIDKGISGLVKNHDLVERAARPYIVGYLCKMLLRRKGRLK